MNNRIRKITSGMMCFISSMLILGACNSDHTSLVESDQGLSTSGELLAPNIRYQVSFDEKVTELSRIWPEDIAARFKHKVTSDDELIIDYEARHQKLGFDENGNMLVTYEYFDGNEETNMPASMYEELKHQMPAQADDHNPTKRLTVKDGFMTYFGENGELLRQEKYASDQFKIDPAVLDSMKAAAQQSTSAETKIARNIKALNESDISFNLIGSSLASFSIEVNSEKVSRFEKTIDLKTGEEVRHAVVLPNGNYETITLMNYKMVEGHPVMETSETLNFGMHNGEWLPKGRTILNRENINVIFN